jgi:hypothetical protein
VADYQIRREGEWYCTAGQGASNHVTEKSVVLAMGKSALTEDFSAIQNYICAFSNATVHRGNCSGPHEKTGRP